VRTSESPRWPEMPEVAGSNPATGTTDRNAGHRLACNRRRSPTGRRRLPQKEDSVGSNPSGGTKPVHDILFARVAQLVGGVGFKRRTVSVRIGPRAPFCRLRKRPICANSPSAPTGRAVLLKTAWIPVRIRGWAPRRMRTTCPWTGSSVAERRPFNPRRRRFDPGPVLQPRRTFHMALQQPSNLGISSAGRGLAEPTAIFWMGIYASVNSPYAAPATAELPERQALP
jgi:hypothetical protein